MQLLPAEILKPYIKSYTLITVDRDLKDEVFYPSGYVDLVISVSDGEAITTIDGRSRKTPGVEVLGHLTRPSTLTVSKGTAVFIARMYPFASSLFVTDSMSEFTNFATDAYGIFSRSVHDFHDALMEVNAMEQKARLLDKFLIGLLRKNETQLKKLMVIRDISAHIYAMGDRFESKLLSRSYGLSERYIEQLFTNMVGITPNKLYAVHRFNKSLGLVLRSHKPLTSIGYDCGYYDQAHFIKEFRKFTGITPFEARAALSPKGEEFQQAVNIGF